MALLSEAERKKYFAALGLGEYNKDNILKLQKKYLLRRADWDGIYGTNTDNLLRHLKAVKDNCKNFAPQEFRCGCNGKYCSGYPTWMKPMELANIQAIRTHFGKPMTVTCGVRCSKYNSIVGGISNSEHKKGLAVDYYISGVTDTLANRKKSVKWIKTLPNHHYTYGNGIYVETVNGKTYTGSKSASGMGNALHTDSREGSPAPAPSPVTPDGKLVIDGVGGAATVKAMQRFFGTTQDGVISGQNKSLKKYYPSLTAVKFGSGGSPMVKNLQRWVGTSQDGVLGQATVKAWQKKIGVTADGIFGTASMKAWQKYLNEHEKAVYPIEPTPTAKTLIDKEIDACIVQADWMKNYKYKWQQNPTIPKSKKYGTCVTYVACVLQRIGILKSGQFIWISNKGKVEGANSKMTVTYPSGTLKSNKSKLKRGDIVIGGNGKTGAGQGSHIFVLTGKWTDAGSPYIYDQESANRVKAGKSPQHTWKGSFKMIALIRLK